MKATSLSLIFVCLLHAMSYGQQVKDSLTADLAQIIKNSKIPGMSVCIVNNSKILYSKGFGYKNKEEKLPYDSFTVQPVASISKTILGLAIMKLVEEGKVSLNTPINNILPFKVINPHFPNSEIKLLHLVTHTSGIIETDEADDGSYYIIDRNAKKSGFPEGHHKFYKKYLKNKNKTLSSYLKSYLTVNGEHYKPNIFGAYESGTKFSYTNLGASLAAYIVELVSGKPYQVFTKQELLVPLNMTNTGWQKPIDSDPNVTKLYFHNGYEVPEYYLITFPSGGLHTNSNDMARFLKEVISGYYGNGNLLKPESYKTLLSNQMGSKILSGEKIGVFWNIDAEGNFRHGGAEIGTASNLIVSPSLNKAFFMMVNISSFEDDELQKDYIQLLITISKYAKRLQ